MFAQVVRVILNVTCPDAAQLPISTKERDRLLELVLSLGDPFLGYFLALRLLDQVVRGKLGELALTRCAENNSVPSATLKLAESINNESLGNIWVRSGSTLSGSYQGFPTPPDIGKVPEIPVCTVFTTLTAPVEPRSSGFLCHCFSAS